MQSPEERAIGIVKRSLIKEGAHIDDKDPLPQGQLLSVILDTNVRDSNEMVAQKLNAVLMGAAGRILINNDRNPNDRYELASKLKGNRTVDSLVGAVKRELENIQNDPNAVA